MKQIILFVTCILITGMAQAVVFKCKTSTGIIYSERPCPTGSAESNIRSIQPLDQQQTDEPLEPLNQQPAIQQQTSQSGINNVNAVPLPVPGKQRQAYESFLSRPSPRAFIICNDGRVMTYSGNDSFVKQRLSSLPDGCAPYAINDDVVWAGK